MHRSVRFVLQPYKSRNPPLAAVTQARRDANSGSYGYKAVATKQPLNKGHPVPDIAHAPDQIGLLHENYPHVLAATFRFNAFFAHQAPILYYIFRPFAILHIVENIYFLPLLFMHISQISIKSAPQRAVLHLFLSVLLYNYRYLFLFKMRKMPHFEQFDQNNYSLPSLFSSSNVLAARSLSSERQKSSRSQSGSIIRISASDAISAPKKRRIF